MANTLSIDQVSPLLRSVLSQATGRTDLASLDTTSLLTIGKAAIMQKPDQVLNSLSQVLSRTIFSIRPYIAKFSIIRTTPEKYGNYVRKLKILNKETDVDNTKAYDLKEGASIDMYQVDGTVCIELKFAGQQTYTIDKTIYMTQLNTCFNSANEFAEFISMIMTYVKNKIEAIHESTGRALVAGTIAGICADPTSASTGRVVHLLTEYKEVSKQEITNIYDPAVFPDFVQWVYSKIKTVSRMMAEYSTMYQTNLTKGSSDQHSPQSMQNAFWNANFFDQVDTRVKANTFHNDVLQLIPNSEMVGYWQSIKSPDGIDVKNPEYLSADGEVTKGEAQTLPNVFGIIADRDAFGFTPVFESVLQTPVNAAGEYYNIFWHFNERHWIDYTEKAVVFLMD